MREPIADYTRPPDPWERSQMPPAEQSAELLQRLEPLLRGTRALVGNGLSWLRWAWDELPQVKVLLLREGEALEAALQEPAQGRIPVLTVRGCGWYVEMQLLRAEANGSERPPGESKFLRELKALLPFLNGNGTGDNGDEPDPPLWVKIIRVLVDAVSSLEATQVNMQADMAEMKSDISGMQVEIADIKDTLREHSSMFTRIDRKLDEHSTSFDRVDRRLGKIWGEIGSQKGEVFESMAIRTMTDWVNAYCWQRKRPQPFIETLWSDRNDKNQIKYPKWNALVSDLGIPDWDMSLRLCDILLRVTWPQQNTNPSLLITGEVSTSMNQQRQMKVKHQYDALTQAGFPVLPVLFGQNYRVSVPTPDLLAVRLTDDDLEELLLLRPPANLYTSLDRILAWPDDPKTTG